VKRCAKCGLTKEVKYFAFNKKRYDGLQVYCRSCKANWDKNYYSLNKAEHQIRVKEYLNRTKRKFWDYLKQQSCIDCGNNNPIVLEFDHIDSSTKKGSIAYLVNQSKCSWETLLKEIAKCEVRCANCHRIKTAKQLNWYKYLVP
jgi:hypothetical protein